MRRLQDLQARRRNLPTTREIRKEIRKAASSEMGRGRLPQASILGRRSGETAGNSRKTQGVTVHRAEAVGTRLPGLFRQF